MTLDLDMPQIDGEALLEKISGKSPGYDDGFLADLRIIIISGLSDAEIRRAMKAGAHAAIRKPFTVDELVNTVRALATSDAGS
jgi:CheY-like chemotaxis protein